MPTHLDQPDHGRHLVVESRNIIKQSRRLIDLTRERLDQESAALPTAGPVSMRVGCEACGARATYRNPADTRAFFASHPYACDSRNRRALRA